MNALHHNPGWFLFLFVATITFTIPSQADTARWDRARRWQVEEPAGLGRKVKMGPPMLFIHVKGAAYNYWGRVLAGKLHRLPQAKLTKGLEWQTQSVLLVHRFVGKGEPKMLLHYNRRLRQPLKATVLPK